MVPRATPVGPPVPDAPGAGHAPTHGRRTRNDNGDPIVGAAGRIVSAAVDDEDISIAVLQKLYGQLLTLTPLHHI